MEIRLKWTCDVLGPRKERKEKSCGLGVRSGPKYRGIGVVKRVKYNSVSVRDNRRYINGVIVYIYILIGIIIIIICES